MPINLIILNMIKFMNTTNFKADTVDLNLTDYDWVYIDIERLRSFLSRNLGISKLAIKMRMVTLDLLI